jgi:hypothetical protein
VRTEDLHSYIAKFREWLNQQGAHSLRAEQESLLCTWRDELAAAERLLEERTELPIALLGPAQQGKSSLINALLGENVLPVGGAVGACTCVVTSVHHRPADGYRAEIDFISLGDWKAELMAMREALDSPLSDEDTNIDRDECLAAQEAALAKFRAVYRREPAGELSTILNDSALDLPEDIAWSMSAGQSVAIDEKSPLTLRNKVRRYLVGREQHDDGQFWPLISRVRIYGDFDVLSNGVVLVDLPGLNDPNPAREQVTKKYLEEARYIWLVCNSQTGIDRVFTQVLRDNGFLLRLFLEGRLEAFAVIATRIDDINLESVLSQMGVDPDDFDGNCSPALDFRRREIATHIQEHLLDIAEDIANRADSKQYQDTFLQRVRSIPVFSISTSAYLHAIDRMPLYKGMILEREESHVPSLIEHLHRITLEQSYRAQVEASFQRLCILHDQVRRFFLDQIRRIEVNSDEARREWDAFSHVADQTIHDGQDVLKQIRIRFEESLRERCLSFEQRLLDLEAKAAGSLHALFTSWRAINWRSLRAAVQRGGQWFSRALQREFNLNRDIARVYLDLLPFVWEEFFETHLAGLIEEVAAETQAELQRTAARLMGAMDMLRCQPAGIRESMETSLRTAEQSFELQSGKVRADLRAQIHRTRQRLSSGMIETASSFMQPAYSQAVQEPIGDGIQRRILEIITRHAKQHAPALFITMRQELAEGVDILQASMKPQLSRIVEYGEGILKAFQQNVASNQVVTPEQSDNLQAALNCLPESQVHDQPDPFRRESELGVTSINSSFAKPLVRAEPTG